MMSKLLMTLMISLIFDTIINFNITKKTISHNISLLMFTKTGKVIKYEQKKKLITSNRTINYNGTKTHMRPM